jgi:hypothetical protein
MNYVLLLVAVGVTIYALVDCWRSSDDEVRGLPRPAWVLAILLFPLIGGVAYLAFGRLTATIPASRGRTLAPDDDPEFLRQLEQRRSQQELQNRRERRDRERQARKDQAKEAKEQRKDAKDQQGTTKDGDPEGGDHSGRPAG